MVGGDDHLAGVGRSSTDGSLKNLLDRFPSTLSRLHLVGNLRLDRSSMYFTSIDGVFINEGTLCGRDKDAIVEISFEAQSV
mmetsp:Transcript_27606/g.40597  ORF Transcript_27606/g.40597 Transcript_27606/m.40597 type:complete len:81 (-) Transcript_27606:30-272(-)